MADPKRSRRRLLLVIGIVLGVVVYGLAVQRTGVSLDEITSENRQERLVLILRSLAQPELVTYDFDQDQTEVPFFIPCAGNASPAAAGGVTVEPGCGEPEGTVTLVGRGFEPFAQGRISFIPDSEFDVTLPLGIFSADRDGAFTATLELPDRPSPEPQVIRVSVPKRLGTWGSREVVWTDTNENGVRDEGIIGGNGLDVTVEGARVEVAAAALLDATNQVVEFVTTGEPVIAADGPARGATPDPLGATPGEVSISGLDAGLTSVAVSIAGPEESDVSSWRVAVYEGITGEVVATEALGDQIELSPRVSEQTLLTIDKIIDTVFLALVATTAGLVVALPLSFVAARNLMQDVSTTVIGLGLGLLAIPLGVALGAGYVELQRRLLDELLSSNLTLLSLLVVAGVVTYVLARQIFFGSELRSPILRTGRSLLTMVSLALALEGLFALLVAGGEALKPPFGAFDFVPGLFSTLGEVGAVLLPIITGLIGASILIGVSRRSAFWLITHVSPPVRALLGYTVMALAGAVVAGLIGAGIDWLYQIADRTVTVAIPAMAGVVLGLVLAFFGRRRGEIKIGLTVYYIARTIFNTLRSIEPLVMVIVFVVWVGFGEFAGSLALALHTAAALAKLYSEQVESISPGPMEAVRATGANRLQSIVYAVVPQIVPPYISFTMYRWDINVRMSTILGFAGGGGIGFLLQQNVQLSQYRAASVQMLAIAIVVASMDYASSKLRQRFT